MKSVMWIQSDDPGGNDHLFVDGVLIPEGDESVRVKAINVLLRAQESRYQRKRVVDKLRKEAGSPNFTLAQCITMGFLYKSIFNEIASDGRLQSFVIWCSNSVADKAWEIAKSNAGQLHFSLRENEYTLVKAFIKNNKEKQIASFFIFLFLFIFAYVLFSH